MGIFDIHIDTDGKFTGQINHLHKEIFKERNALHITQICEPYVPNRVEREKLTVVALDEKNNVMGWSMGEFNDVGAYYMRNSAVWTDMRRVGVYTELIKFLDSYLLDRGCYVMESLHHPSNNGVLIAKLKNGFKIHGIEVDVQFGTLVKLKKYIKSEANDVFDKRVGYKKW